MIGGEFEIDLSIQQEFVPMPGTYYYASGRTALYQILRSLAPRHQKVWMPDWLCHTMVEAAEKAGYEVVFYELNNDFLATLGALDRSGFRDGDAMLMVNYFGLQDLSNTANAIKEYYPEAIVIEDDVQAYWSFVEKENPYADYRFTSMRKAFPIPDGGLVKTSEKMLKPTRPNTFAPLKIKAGEMKLCRGQDGIKDEEYLELFRQGDELISENYESCMSEDSKRLFAGFDFETAKRRRQNNAHHILRGLKLLNIEPLISVSDDKVPLFIPVLLPGERDKIRQRMFANEVFCPIHWPMPDKMNTSKGKMMTEHELSLIVDQRYSDNDMNLILSLL